MSNFDSILYIISNLDIKRDANLGKNIENAEKFEFTSSWSRSNEKAITR